MAPSPSPPPKGKFYYQGELDSAQIPWLVSVTTCWTASPYLARNWLAKKAIWR